LHFNNVLIIHPKNFIKSNWTSGNQDFVPGALSGKILLVKIVENNKMDDYFRAG